MLLSKPTFHKHCDIDAKIIYAFFAAFANKILRDKAQILFMALANTEKAYNKIFADF